MEFSFYAIRSSNDGTLVPLKSTGVDTGMGLERLAAVIQHENNNYDIDSFKELTSAVVALTPKEKRLSRPCFSASHC